MKILLNGEPRTFTAEMTVGDLLSVLTLDPEAVVVEVNQNILETVSRQNYSLSDGDHVEIIRFVGGG